MSVQTNTTGDRKSCRNLLFFHHTFRNDAGKYACLEETEEQNRPQNTLVAWKNSWQAPKSFSVQKMLRIP